MKLILIVLMLLSTCGCDMRKHTIQFKDQTVFEVNEKINACNLVLSVDDIEITESMYQSGQIVVKDNLIVTCESDYTPTKLGDHALQYFINDKQKEDLVISVADTIAPTITLSQDEYVVEEGNEYFDIKNEVSFSDNYDKEFLHSLDHNININTVGDYEVKAYAVDSSGNESRKNITVRIVEKEKEIETVYVNNGSYSSHTSGSTNNSQAGGIHSGSSGSDDSSGGYTPEPTPQPQPQPQPAPTPAGISGVHNISVSVGTGIDTVYFLLSDISASSSVTIDISEVNTSVPGIYTVYYSAVDGSSASCTVTVYE